MPHGIETKTWRGQARIIIMQYLNSSCLTCLTLPSVLPWPADDPSINYGCSAAGPRSFALHLVPSHAPSSLRLRTLAVILVHVRQGPLGPGVP